MAYHHLTYTDRIKLNALLQIGKKIPAIALEIDRAKSTLYRELHRNSFNKDYFLDTAQAISENRRRLASQDRCEDDELFEQIEQGLRHGMSPEQIVGRLRAEDVESVSVSTIYAWIKRDKADGGDLWMTLRRSRKTYRKAMHKEGGLENGLINRVSLDERPDIVEYRKRKGDLEGDTVIGARQQGVLLTMNDRVTKKVSIDKLSSKKSGEVCEAMIKATQKFKGKKFTCTLDNGKEFAGHEDFTEVTGIKVYFCRPMHSEERGSNENTNGLIRQYLPKGMDFRKVSKTRISFIEYKLNSRPRKSLNFLTPLEAESNGKVQFQFFH
jgi:transposase, IS30 family